MSNINFTDNPNDVKDQKDTNSKQNKQNPLGEKIRKFRKAKNWSQEELAASCDLSTVALGKIERGVTIPRMATMRKLEEALGLLQGSLVIDYQTSDDESAALDRISAILMNGDLTDNQLKKMVKIVDLIMELVNDWE